MPEHGAVLDLFKRSKNRVGFSPRKPKLGRSTGREMGAPTPGQNITAGAARCGIREWEQHPHPPCQQWQSTKSSLLLSVRRSKVHCCSKEMFSRQRIPDFRIKEYRYTSSNCTHRAVL